MNIESPTKLPKGIELEGVNNKKKKTKNSVDNCFVCGFLFILTKVCDTRILNKGIFKTCL